MPLRPHSLAPHQKSARVAFVSKNFAAMRGISHTGLGVSCQLKCNVLWQECGIWCENWSCSTPAEIAAKIDQTQADAVARRETRLSHVVIAAPWVPTSDIGMMVAKHHGVEFVTICHSDVGFLNADTQAIRLVKEYAHSALIGRNFNVAGNSRRFVDWARLAISPHFLYLPNIYDCSTFRPPDRPPFSGRALRIGSFGAQRALKNHVTAAAAALEIARTLHADVEFHVSSGRDDNPRTYQPIQQILSDHRTKLVCQPWRDWPNFRDLVGYMDLNLQPSYTESYNVVTADSIAEGVPMCVSPTIEITPPSWVAPADDAHLIAITAKSLLHNPHAVREGQENLRRITRASIAEWKHYLLGSA